jgi:hypothetical protein
MWQRVGASLRVAEKGYPEKGYLLGNQASTKYDSRKLKEHKGAEAVGALACNSPLCPDS